MRKKATGFYADSLEMLLDTMCNVLGGIVFLTLTLAQLVGNTPPAPPEYYENQTLELSNALAQVTVTNLLVETETKMAIERLQQPRQLWQTNQMRLPTAGATAKLQWDVIVSDGKIYPLNLLPEGRPGAVQNTRGVVFQRQGNGDLRVAAKPGAGEEAENGVVQMVENFKRASKTNFYFAFYVYEDSFEAFNRAKETAARLGFQYGWEPLARGTELNLNPGVRGIPPQN
jgi:hypothetical protein